MRNTGMLALALGIVVAGAAFAAETEPVTQAGEILREGDEYTQAFDWLAALPGKAAVDVENTNGSISVTAWDQPDVHVAAEKRMSVRGGFFGLFRKSAENAVDAMAKTEIIVTSDAEGVHVRTKHGRGNSPSVYYVVKVPRSCDFQAETSNGKVEASGLTGTTRLTTVNGEVVCSGQNGPAFLESSNGRIRAEECAGAVEAETVNGRVSLNEIAGDISAEAVNGSITLAHPDALADNSNIACKTVNGAVEIMLSGSSAFAYRLRSYNGRIANDFAGGTTAASTGRPRSSEGSVGDGRARVEAETTNGSITLKAL